MHIPFFQPCPKRVKQRLGTVRAVHSVRARSPRNQRGVALIMVLVITTVVAALAYDLSNSTMVNVRAAANARDQLQAYFHARSALELEFFVLRFQNMVKGSLGAFLPIPLFELSGMLVSSDTVKGIIDRKESPFEGVPLEDAEERPFGQFEGSFWIEEVVDENRKLNLNQNLGFGKENKLHLLLGAMFSDRKYDALFESIGESRDPIRNRIEIIANITDWVDGDSFIDPVTLFTNEAPNQSSSEDTRYDHLPYNVKYHPKNALLSSLAELRMVPGINDAFMQLFSRHFTVWSDNKFINLRTADDWMMRAVIMALLVQPPMPSDEDKFRIFFEQKALQMAMPPPLNKMTIDSFRALVEQARFVIDPAKFQALSEVLRFDDSANVYRITAVGRVNNASASITTVWRSISPTAPGEIFYWREE